VLVYTAISRSFIQSDTLGETISGITCISQIGTGGVFLCIRKARRTKKTLLKCEIVRVKVGGLCTEHALAGELQTLEPVDPRQQLGSRVLASLQYNDDGNP
jgi:hypothetical protein